MNKTEILTMVRPAYVWANSVALGLYVECSQRYFYYGWKGAAAGVGAFVLDRIQDSRQPDELPLHVGEVLVDHSVEHGIDHALQPEVADIAA